MKTEYSGRYDGGRFNGNGLFLALLLVVLALASIKQMDTQLKQDSQDAMRACSSWSKRHVQKELAKANAKAGVSLEVRYETCVEGELP